jgi:Ca2+-binding EF-hand superfamily protein
MTIGRKECDFFQRQNEHLRSRGLPYFDRMEKSLGNSIYLWVQRSFDSEAFLTDILLAHKNPDSPYYRDLLQLNHKKKDKYDVLTHDETDFQILYRKSANNNQGIKKIEVSFTEDEETKFVVEGYMKLEPNLSQFGLPEVSIWLEFVSKKKKTATTNTDALIAEVKKVRELLTEHPKDKNLQELLIRLNEKLEIAYKKEESNEVTNPLAVAVDLLSLNEEDMEKWLGIYEKVDKELRGKVTLDEMYEYFEITPTEFNNEVFYSVDAVDEIGFIEFGDFIRAIGTYCFFGKDEIVKFIYVYIDKERKGYCLFSQFNDFIEKLHPYEKMRSRRAIKGMQLINGVKPDTKLTYADFKRIQEQYPALFLPAFLFQDTLRKKVSFSLVEWFRCC